MARWIWLSGSKCKCSKCGGAVNVTSRIHPYGYCPYCTADMNDRVPGRGRWVHIKPDKIKCSHCGTHFDLHDFDEGANMNCCPSCGIRMG